MTSSSATVHPIRTRPHPFDKDYKYLSIEIPESSPHVTIVRLNRPKKINAICAAMWREIGHAFGRLGCGEPGDDSRCLLLTGSGRGFCAGIDVQDLSFVTGGDEECEDPARKGLALIPKVRQMQACFTALETCPIPVVAAMHGVCVGAGIDLACCADIRICAAKTIFSVREVQMGLAADVGTLQRLPKIVGNSSWVSEVCLTGRNFKAAEALRMGFVSSASLDSQTSLVESAVKLCHTMASHSPVAVVGTKKALLFARDHTVTDSLEQIISYNAMALQSDDLPKSVQAALEKQEATFQSLLRHSRL
ncbi:Delta(3,5)-Delta(2,4)-dienoyl-CoA isomerase, mitochondrial [Seminavis robusta]|uniref:Delta(3,5)-Delta(2,4)-dienoyl-CoA isomerase, mitochondrial n=1 Tax=Seminavis robusta TaxID=568900 RepID=A0A9N8DVU2_9STRA|nr:Delta(3,5)-Delta(2,4)-dienoyl-CoA isomerase, mitochondrial [Seminavis robusta]|eukprot:Sro394_g133760.1 Delta(3,5)-Delta(2,4)-dienoyl-CoA isomerase, mitochondrial (306) ;mRNA; f:8460-9377